jgi:hypothetical protein
MRFYDRKMSIKFSLTYGIDRRPLVAMSFGADDPTDAESHGLPQVMSGSVCLLQEIGKQERSAGHIGHDPSRLFRWMPGTAAGRSLLWVQLGDGELECAG